MEEELKFEKEVRDTEDNRSNLGNRGILTLKISNTRMQSLEEVSAKVKLSSVWEDALFWLTSCGEAAVVKQGMPSSGRVEEMNLAVARPGWRCWNR